MAPARQLVEQPLPPTAVYKHSKVSLEIRPSKLLYVAGQKVEGILELACSSDKAWLGRIGIEFRGAEQLQSLDHAASQTFVQSDVTFQSPSTPPSNAVISTAPSSGGYWPARKGVTRFPFQFIIPTNAPTSCTFFNNASIAYTLLSTVHVQHQGERQILTKRIDIQVVERWSDWQAEDFHEPSDAQRREKVGGLGFGGEGSIWVEVTITDRFFFRGWNLQHPHGGIERERARNEIGVSLSVKNATTRTLSGVKVALLRRMKILSGDSTPVPEGPRITETVEEVSLTGREWEFPPGGDERTVNCSIDVPSQERFLSIRKTKLFQIHTLAKITLEMGVLT